MKKIVVLLLLVSVFMTTGCAISFYKKSPKDKAKIEELSSELERLARLREEERNQFELYLQRLLNNLLREERV